MAEFSLEFAERMSEASESILESQKIDSDRAAIYSALVACEIAIKSALESAGVSNIPKTHDLGKLMQLLTSCTVVIDSRRVPASRFRGLVVDSNYANATVGHLLQGEKYGASVFPNQIRYGDLLAHFPVALILKLSKKVVSWVKDNGSSIEA
ncbi:MAG: HEPN domain-containing protein [Paraglaciecola sp.]|uniref:HEPN domain-containing protein n=1 Tax=Paraglaciecola sp. TaxID=1920173 RepID=UPI0032976690